jgi:hypothetical protein
MSPGYLEAAGTRLLGGRDVSWHDTAQTPYVAIVNQTFARKMWGETTAMGQRFILNGNLTEVVGVAQDGKYHDLEESPQPAVYLPLSQSEQSETVFVVRSRRAPSEMAAALERTLSGIEPNVPITVQNWQDAVEGELFPARAATVALGVMGLLAAMLAVTGIFGMAAYSVSRRKKELGIRVALGAPDASDERGGGAAHGAAGRGVDGGSAVGRVREPPAGADCVSGESAGSRGGGRGGADDGAAGRGSVRYSSLASACPRSIQTHAGRVNSGSELLMSWNLQ